MANIHAHLSEHKSVCKSHAMDHVGHYTVKSYSRVRKRESMGGVQRQGGSDKQKTQDDKQ